MYTEDNRAERSGRFGGNATPQPRKKEQLVDPKIVYAGESKDEKERWEKALRTDTPFTSNPDSPCPVAPRTTSWGFYRSVYWSNGAFGSEVIKHNLGKGFKLTGKWEKSLLMGKIDTHITGELNKLNVPKAYRGRTAESAKPPFPLYAWDNELGFHQPFPPTWYDKDAGCWKAGENIADSSGKFSFKTEDEAYEAFYANKVKEQLL